MKQLASLFMHSRTQAHVFHLRVKGAGSLAAHLALQTYYEGIIPYLIYLLKITKAKMD
jgi:DNA-binding ferritin-like protein